MFDTKEDGEEDTGVARQKKETRTVKTLKASQARIPMKEFSRVACGAEHIRIQHRSAGSVVLISEDEFRAFQEWEDAVDVFEAKNALEEFQQSGEAPIPWEQVKKEACLYDLQSSPEGGVRHLEDKTKHVGVLDSRPSG